jgi:cyclopropane fatty-acyl-phospholipid synthase-like methyltransferase
MTWYEQWFNREEYEIVYEKRDEEEARLMADLVEKIISPDPGSRILDVGCGRGRHAIEFAERGYSVTGLDLSERAIRQARERAEEAGLDIRLLQGDMRDPVDTEAFDGVVNLFTAFGYFEEWEEHQRAINAMTTAVIPGGFVVQDFMNASYVESGLVPSDVRTVDDTEIRQQRWIEDGRIRKKIVFTRGEESHTFFESVALLRREDFERLYDSAGLHLFDIRGDYHGEAHQDSSPRMILFSRKV